MINFVKTSDLLPIPYDTDEPCAEYYLVQLKQYPPTLAMYLEDENGECAWYTNYYSKIIVPVLGWTKVTTTI